MRVGLQKVENCDNYTANNGTNLTKKETYALHTRSIYADDFHTVASRMPATVQVNIANV